jgi:hypothetical protein
MPESSVIALNDPVIRLFKLTTRLVFISRITILWCFKSAEFQITHTSTSLFTNVYFNVVKREENQFVNSIHNCSSIRGLNFFTLYELKM